MSSAPHQYLLALSVGIILVAGVCSRLVSRIGARPLLLAGTPLAAAGRFWLSPIDEHAHNASDMLGPMVQLQVRVTSRGVV